MLFRLHPLRRAVGIVPRATTFPSSLRSITIPSAPTATPPPISLQPAPTQSFANANAIPQPAGIDFTKGHAARIASILESKAEESHGFAEDELSHPKPAAAPESKAPQTNKERRRNQELTLTEAFVNNIMKDGKKARARRTLLDALQHIQRETGQDPHKVLQSAVTKVSPLVKIVTTKRGAKGIQTPTPLNERQRRRFGILWIVEAASGSKQGTSFGQRIGMEVLAILEDKSAALLKRTNIHKQALSNRSNILMVERKMRRSF
ncbi:ribosomal protein S7 domain-containing protein [Powellomyces hirtus]|nr:ribosomal protein S7 domain-containing protein [Powellomyces hirtus]